MTRREKLWFAALAIGCVPISLLRPLYAVLVVAFAWGLFTAHMASRQ